MAAPASPPIALRGPALSFTGDPFRDGLDATMVHEPDAIVVMAEGRITHFGPASRIVPLLPAFPIGNYATKDPDFDVAYLQARSSVSENAVSLRLDYTASAKHSFYMRYFRNQANAVSPEGVTGRQAQIQAQPQNAVVSWQQIWKPNLLNTFKVGFNEAYTRVNGIAPVIPGVDLSAITVSITGSVANPGIAGQGVEQGPTAAVFAAPRHAYTRHLLAAEPAGRPERPPGDPPVLLSATDVRVWFPIKAGVFRRTVDHVKAVDGVSIQVREGRTLGVVGESGSGKTTLGLAVLRLLPARGRVVFAGRDIQALTGRALRPLRRELQIVFQDPYGSLSPRLTVARIVGEGLEVHAIGRDTAAREALIVDALTEVGLDPSSRDRYPHEFSGGQRQRIAVARALVLKPRLVVLDEPTSALDRSVQAQIVELLRELQARHGLAYVFISHDLKVVRALADDLVVMRAGQVVEAGATEEVFERPRTPYTRALLAAALELEALDLPD
jgi:ABC-type oligopeptide transport system ATPase subunit